MLEYYDTRVLKSSDAHGLADLHHLGLADRPGLCPTLFKHLGHDTRVLHELLVLGADGGEVAVKVFNERLLECLVAALVLFIKRRELGLATDELVDGVDVLGPTTRRVSDDTHDCLSKLVAGGEEWDGVAVALAHLAPVGTGHHSHLLGDERLGELEDILLEYTVELLCRVARILHMLLLVLSYGHHVCIVEKNIGGHEHRVVEGAHRNLLSFRLGFFVGVRALQVGHRGDGVEYPAELGVRRYLRLLIHGRLLRVEATGEVGHDALARETAHHLGILDEVECVVVGKENIGRIFARIEKVYKGLNRAEIVANMEVAGRLHPSEEYRFAHRRYDSMKNM